MKLDLLAILGRGIRQICKDDPWVPTDDLEMHDEGFTPRARRLPTDDGSPNCFVGGAMLNVEAGAVLCSMYSPQAVVCGYGGQSPYLLSLDDAPSDSEVLSSRLKELLQPPHPEIIIWPRGRVAPSGRTNTDQELINIFELAVNEIPFGIATVGIVTVFVHLMRTVAMAQMHLSNPAWEHLRLQFFASEDVLYQHDPEEWGPRLQAMNGSQSFMRTMFYECRGLNALLAGNY